MARFKPAACKTRAISAPTRFAPPVTRATPEVEPAWASRVSMAPPIILRTFPYSTSPHVSDLLQVILLGVIEGITEFLPISSTGHLLIAEHWLGARSDVFNVVIQAGAILAVNLIYWQRLKQ